MDPINFQTPFGSHPNPLGCHPVQSQPRQPHPVRSDPGQSHPVESTTFGPQDNPQDHPQDRPQCSPNANDTEKFQIPSMNDDSCNICLKSFNERAEFPVFLRCGHVFGHKCISRWIEMKHASTCPSCRKDAYDDCFDYYHLYNDEMQLDPFNNEPLGTVIQSRPIPVGRSTLQAPSSPSVDPRLTPVETSPQVQYSISNFVSEDKKSIFYTLVIIHLSKQPAEEMLAAFDTAFVPSWNNACGAVLRKLQRAGDNYKELADQTVCLETMLSVTDQNANEIEQARFKAMLTIGTILSRMIDCDFNQRLDVARFVIELAKNYQRLPPSGLNAPHSQWIFMAIICFHSQIAGLVRAFWDRPTPTHLPLYKDRFMRAIKLTFVLPVRYFLKKRVRGNDGWSCPVEF